MDVGKLQTQLVDFTAFLFREGILDRQFTQLQGLRDDSGTDFVVEVISDYFKDVERLITNLGNALDQRRGVDFQVIDAAVHQLKGSSASVGAQRVKNTCIDFRKCCDEYNLEGCIRCLQQLKFEYSLLKSNLEQLFQLEQQILAAGGTLPVVDS